MLSTHDTTDGRLLIVAVVVAQRITDDGGSEERTRTFTQMLKTANWWKRGVRGKHDKMYSLVLFRNESSIERNRRRMLFARKDGRPQTGANVR